MKIPDNTKIQSVDLIIKNLERSLQFYNELLGFKIIERSDDKAYLSSNGKYPYIVYLEGNPNVKPMDRHSAGLYHTAFRFPDRESLGKTFLHLHENNVKFYGFSDHIVSEAIYLGDPDGNGVELYVDKPKSEWEWQMGQIVMDTLPLNLNVITNAVKNRKEPWNGIDERTEIGHIHLRVTDLMKAEKFYSNLLGFNVTNSNYEGALFMSAGGYHHHIGTNIWSSANGTLLEENSLGLKSFTIKTGNSVYINEIKENAGKNGIEYFETNKLQNGIHIKDFDDINVNLIA